MARVRVHSQSQALFMGPSPSSGFHFVDQHGSPTGDPNAHNIIKQLNGIQSINYELISERQEVSELGRRELIGRPNINLPVVQLDFEYLTADLKNEARMGFNINFATGHSYTDSFYKDNRDVFLFSGMLSRDSYPAYSGFHVGDDESNFSAWPRAERDCRNIYLAIAPEGIDIKHIPDDKFEQMSSVAFGECYMDSYSVNMEVGQPIKCGVQYTCYNMKVEESGSGIIPSVDSTGFNEENENIYVIPRVEGEISGYNVRSGVSQVARATDISFSIKSTGYSNETSGILDAIVDLADIKVQSASISLNFERYTYIGMGHRAPIDKPIKYPIICNAQIGAIFGELQVSKLKNLLEKDYPFDISLECRSPKIYCPGFDPNEIIAKFDFLGANIDSISFDNSVQQHGFATLSFSTDVAQGVTGKGLFMSGKLMETGEAFSGYNF